MIILISREVPLCSQVNFVLLVPVIVYLYHIISHCGPTLSLCWEITINIINDVKTTLWCIERYCYINKINVSALSVLVSISTSSSSPSRLTTVTVPSSSTSNAISSTAFECIATPGLYSIIITQWDLG